MGIKVDRSPQARDDRRPHMFLCHSSADKPFVRGLAARLLAAGVDVWLDDWELQPGDSLRQVLSGAIERSRYVGVVLTDTVSASEWAMKELEMALDRERERGEEVVIPLLCEGASIPVELAERIYLDFKEGYFVVITRLAGVVHGVTMSRIEEAINKKAPRSMGSVLEALSYTGIDAHHVLDADDFDEIARAGGAVRDDRVLFSPESIARAPNISERVRRLMTQITTDTRW